MGSWSCVTVCLTSRYWKVTVYFSGTVTIILHDLWLCLTNWYKNISYIKSYLSRAHSDLFIQQCLLFKWKFTRGGRLSSSCVLMYLSHFIFTLALFTLIAVSFKVPPFSVVYRLCRNKWTCEEMAESKNICRHLFSSWEQVSLKLKYSCLIG